MTGPVTPWQVGDRVRLDDVPSARATVVVPAGGAFLTRPRVGVCFDGSRLTQFVDPARLVLVRRPTSAPQEVS